MKQYDASDVLPPKLDEPVESGPSVFIQPLPRGFVIGFFGTLIIFVLLLIVAMRVDPQTGLQGSFKSLDWLLDWYS